MTVLGILHCTWTVVCVKSQRWKVSGYHAQKTLLPLFRKIRNHKKGSALDITHARHSQHVQLKVSLILIIFRWDWSWTTTQITFMTDTLCTLLLIRLILFLYIFLQLLPFSWTDWANKILTNIWRTIHLPLQKYTFNMSNY